MTNNKFKNRVSSTIITIIFVFLIFLNYGHSRDDLPILSVSGLIQRPMSFSLEDLKQFSKSTIRFSHINSQKKYKGTFIYEGVLLKDIISFCRISRFESDFSKKSDIIVVIKNRKGITSVLSWGEIFYRNPPDTLIAYNSKPVLPILTCNKCHSGSNYKKWEKPLKRSIRQPGLVVAGDHYSDRSIEDISSIQVLEVKNLKLFTKGKAVRKEAIDIIRNGKRITQIKKLSGNNYYNYNVFRNGDGRGYHGAGRYSGSPLLKVLLGYGVTLKGNDIVIVTASDGYRSVFSSGELQRSKNGSPVIIADKYNNRPIGKTGKFHVVAPGDLLSDRWVKNVLSIEIKTIRNVPKVYIIGIGCGDPDLITLDAISHINKSDVLVCTNDIKEKFSHYIGTKPILFNPLMGMAHFYRNKHPHLTYNQCKNIVKKIRNNNGIKLTRALKQGKTVGFLDYGDPTIYGSWTYWLPRYVSADKIVVRPGVSSLNAANAMIGKNLAANGSLIISVPNGLRENKELVKSAADHGDTLAIFIGLKELTSLVPFLKRYYSDTTPVHIVLKAGYDRTGKIVATDLKNIIHKIKKEKEKFLGLIYIGELLKKNAKLPRQSDKDPL